MGTPDFAAHCLKVLLEAGLNIVAVVTTPDKPKGRGQKIAYSPVKQYLLDNNIACPILQAEKLKSPDFITQLEELNADLFIVVAFRMLPKVVWAMPKYGTFNLHASLLPLYRGAAPIQHAIWNGETKTGVSTFLLNEEIDCGKILFRESIDILPEDNAGTLHDKLMEIGAKLCVKTAHALLDGCVEPIEQENSDNLPSAPKIFKEDCLIDWKKTSKEILLQIRALSPYPAAYTNIYTSEGELFASLKIFKARLCKEKDASASLPVGSFFCNQKNSLKILCGDGEFISIETLQLSNKKQLTIEEFLRGFKFPQDKNLIFI